jgi:hypothetical protein
MPGLPVGTRKLLTSWNHASVVAAARTRNTSRNDNDVGILQGSLGLGGVGVPRATSGHEASDFLFTRDSSAKMPCDVRGLFGVEPTALEEMWERSAATPGVLTTS